MKQLVIALTVLALCTPASFAAMILTAEGPDDVGDFIVAPWSGEFDVDIYIQTDSGTQDLAGADFHLTFTSQETSTVYSLPIATGGLFGDTSEELQVSIDTGDWPTTFDYGFESGTLDPGTYDGFGFLSTGSDVTYDTTKTWIATVTYLADKATRNSLGLAPGVYTIGFSDFTILSDPSALPVDYSEVLGEVTIVPEPASLALLGLGLACLLRRHRR